MITTHWTLEHRPIFEKATLGRFCNPDAEPVSRLFLVNFLCYLVLFLSNKLVQKDISDKSAHSAFIADLPCLYGTFSYIHHDHSM